MRVRLFSRSVSTAIALFTVCGLPVAAPAQVYQSYGTHNPGSDSPCASPDCVYHRAPGDPRDPSYPVYWKSRWTMYRIFNNYQHYPPPYRRRPPRALKEGRDYEVSHGETFYDSTWRGASGEGAMMEHYIARCLPIFPIDNHFSCAFISVGDTAYFVTYGDRPAGMPPVCFFSPLNHPPRRDFIIHLPYSAPDSRRLGAHAQAYSFWIAARDGHPVQTGASPDRTGDQDILFGYAFARDSAGRMSPQSFYFSGYPLAPANAPIVSQNYVGFTVAQPDPKVTWNEVAGLDPKKVPACKLFNARGAPANALSLVKAPKRAPTWGDIGRWKL
jgi:hypothetical protein